MSVDLQPRAAAHLARRRRHRPALLLRRARRLPRRRRDRQVHLHADPHGLPAPLQDEVLRDRGGRRGRRDPPPDPARDPAAPLARQPAGDRLRRRRARRHRHGLVGRVHGRLLKGLAHARRTSITPGALAEAACEIEIDILGEPCGKQDPYVAAHGGICAYTFEPDGTRRRSSRWSSPRDAAAPARPPAAVLHRRGALGLDGALRPGRAHQGGRRGDAREPPPDQGDRPPELRAAAAAATCSPTPS